MPVLVLQFSHETIERLQRAAVRYRSELGWPAPMSIEDMARTAVLSWLHDFEREERERFRSKAWLHFARRFPTMTLKIGAGSFSTDLPSTIKKITFAPRD